MATASAQQPDDQDDQQAVFRKLFRGEAAVSVNEQRIDVANTVIWQIAEDEEVELEEKRLHARGQMGFMFGDREVTVDGDYVRHTKEAETFALTGGAVEETVHGGVEQNMQVEAEVIMGGAYAGTFVGGFLRICAWADFLCWGGWLEVDTVRAEIASVMIRSMMFYGHTAGARILLAYNLMDDFTLRREDIGVFCDAQGTAIHLGAPGASMTMES